MQTDGAVPIHPGSRGGDDEVVRAQRGVRAARERLRDLPQVLVEEPALHQHPLPRRTDGKQFDILYFFGASRLVRYL